ncbi:MAG: glycosyltransferase family 4 protein [Chthoniobacterales bacterium]
MRLGYLYSRYPVISQTFCDMEMLELERRGWPLVICSAYSPLTSLRHEHIARLRAPIHYAPPQKVLQIWEENAKANGTWPAALVDLHARKYGPGFKAAQRARNALWFADLFTREAVDHFHVHFANRAAHTALFVKQVSGLPFSITAHGQDFMTDLGNDNLLREICGAAEFVAAETDYSRDLLRQRCPESAAKIHRVYNGVDLEHFPLSAPTNQNSVPRILSVGRLVAFKGFEYLIDACAELARRGREFACEIIGDGPLREDLQAKIDKLNLNSRVSLSGSLSQRDVLEKVRTADIFALASILDDRGGSDVFPTVILEAMAAARPVVSTRLAGIPELTLHEKTGLLVESANSAALADALDHLLQQPERRSHYGNAGRARIEQDFRIEQTVAPLVELLEQSCSRRPVGDGRASHPPSPSFGAAGSEAATAYLIDRWPDAKLPMLERELREMWRRDVSVIPFVCELDGTARFSSAMAEIAPRLEFLPDAMVLEAEWRTNRSSAQTLEEARAQEEVRAPAAIFLRQARFALALSKLLREKKISHLHATSSRALVCALILQSIVDLTVSATIEARPGLPQDWIKTALQKCIGGRVSDRRLLDTATGSFLIDGGFHLTGRAKFWQEWAQLLQRWSKTGATA